MSQPTQDPQQAQPATAERFSFAKLPKTTLYLLAALLVGLGIFAWSKVLMPQPDAVPAVADPNTVNPAASTNTAGKTATDANTVNTTPKSTNATTKTNTGATPSQGLDVQPVPLLASQATPSSAKPATAGKTSAAPITKPQATKGASPTARKSVALNPFAPFAIDPINPVVEPQPVAPPSIAQTQPVRVVAPQIQQTQTPRNTSTIANTRPVTRPQTTPTIGVQRQPVVVNPSRPLTSPTLPASGTQTPASRNPDTYKFTVGPDGKIQTTQGTTNKPTNVPSNPSSGNNKPALAPVVLPKVQPQTTTPVVRASVPEPLNIGVLPVAPSIIRELVPTPNTNTEDPLGTPSVTTPTDPNLPSINPGTPTAGPSALSGTGGSNTTPGVQNPTATNLPPLARYVQDNAMRIAAVVIGPLNTVILETKDGTVIVPLGGTIPGTDIVVKNITADSVVLLLGDETVTLQKDS